MRYLSVCSGIEAATVAWHPLGWKAAAYSEIEKFPSQVLAHHYPNVPNVGDMTKFKEWTNVSNVDVLVGGTPCQSFSVAGLRKGLDDPRGNLMLTYLAIATKFRPKWLVWENVPGVLSSNGGLDFASLLRGMGECGYGFAYRILDAQYFGVAQRRKRVFVVGCLGDWRAAAAVLFERHSLCGYPAPSREKRENPAKCITRGAGQRYDYETEDFVTQPIPIDSMNHIGRGDKHSMGDFVSGAPSYTLTKNHSHAVAQPIPIDMMNIRGRPSDDGRANRIGRGYGDEGDPMFTITKANHHGVVQPIAFSGQMSNPQTDVDMTQTLQAKNPMAVVQPVYELHSQDSRVRELDEVCKTVSATYGTGGGNIPITLMQAMAVRRLTPVECERLQGFPDNYTNIKEKCPDGPRYKALGNSMAVPVMAWIGKRIQQVENL